MFCLRPLASPRPNAADAVDGSAGLPPPSLEVVQRPATSDCTSSAGSSSSSKLSGRVSSSFGGKLRRQLELELMSQRARAAAAERALADATTENRELTQRVRVLEADLAAYKLQTGLNVLVTGPGTTEGSSSQLTQELRRLRCKLQQRGMELLDKTQKVQEMQQQLLTLQQAPTVAVESAQEQQEQQGQLPNMEKEEALAERQTEADAALVPGQLQIYCLPSQGQQCQTRPQKALLQSAPQPQAWPQSQPQPKPQTQSQPKPQNQPKQQAEAPPQAGKQAAAQPQAEVQAETQPKAEKQQQPGPKLQAKSNSSVSRSASTAGERPAAERPPSALVSASNGNGGVSRRATTAEQHPAAGHSSGGLVRASSLSSVVRASSLSSASSSLMTQELRQLIEKFEKGTLWDESA